MRLPRLLPLLAAALAAVLPAPVRAQGGTPEWTISGTVVDGRTGAAVPQAEVRLPEAGLATRTDSAGRFVLRRVPGVAQRARVTRVGYAAHHATWEPARDTLPLRVVLAAAPVALEELQVRSGAVEHRLERRRRAAGRASVRVFDGDRLERGKRLSVALWVRYYAGLNWAPCRGGRVECVRHRGHTEAPGVLIDDRPAPGGFGALDHYDVEDVARIEVWNAIVVRVYTHEFVRRGTRPVILVAP